VVTLADAYQACTRLARAHYENFPVASRLVPRRLRPHVAAIYAFARGADDLADEGGAPPAQRLAALDAWRERLRRAAGGRVDPADPHAAVFLALADTMERHALPLALFEDLLSAFVQDVTVTRYATWADLLDYCRRSANPVGRLVLRLFGYRDAALDRASDAVCTALQLTNFWQDFARDWAIGRLYLPAEECRAAGADEADLDPAALTPAWRLALGRAAARTRALFEAGRAVCDGVGGRLRWELRLTWLGGVTILDRVEAVEFDVAHRRPTLERRDAATLLWRALRWRAAGAAAAQAW
jgi:squalene synthase HpnC